MSQGTVHASNGNGTKTQTPPHVIEALSRQIDDVRRRPDSDEAWAHLEKSAGELDEPDAVAALYEEVLRGQLRPGVANRIGERAVLFLEAWSAEDPSGLVRILKRLLEIEPRSAWAFERLAVALTVSGSWDDLFEHYDLAIAQAPREQKIKLLEEAANAARDLAGKPERAFQYLLARQRETVNDAVLAESIERLLERNQRWHDLVRFLVERVEQLPPAEGHPLREKIARLHVEKLNDPAEALSQLRRLVDESDENREAVRLLEVIVAGDQWPAAVRRGALQLLRVRHQRANQPAEIVRVLRVGLGFADAVETAALHREIASRLADMGESVEAMDHYAALLALDAHAADARAALGRLADGARAHARRADALVAAAESCRDAMRVELLVEAARAREEKLGDAPAAIELYRRVLGDREAD